MTVFSKGLRFIRRKVAQVVYFFIRDSFDEFAGNSAILQNIQDLQRLISEAINSDRFKIKEHGQEMVGVKDAIKEHGQELAGVKDHLAGYTKNFAELKGMLDDVQKFGGAINGRCDEMAEFVNFSAAKLRMKKKLDDVPGIDYVKFENKYRGTEALIMQRQAEFLPFFEDSTNVLDIGCGRGEFLQLMREKGTHATGVDIDSGMIEICKNKGLNVIESDVIEFLDEINDDELDGVFCSQVIEHFSFREIKWILHTLSKKLRKGSVVLFETINPRCLPAMRRFYLDSTHVQPVDYETLAFYIEQYGFHAHAGVLSSPIDPALDMNTRELSLIDQYGDYALIIHKS